MYMYTLYSKWIMRHGSCQSSYLLFQYECDRVIQSGFDVSHSADSLLYLYRFISTLEISLVDRSTNCNVS